MEKLVKVVTTINQYFEQNKEFYDETANNYRTAIQNAKFQPLYKMRTSWRNLAREYKERMKLLDFRLKEFEQDDC